MDSNKWAIGPSLKNLEKEKSSLAGFFYSKKSESTPENKIKATCVIAKLLQVRQIVPSVTITFP